jgi:hypothetical protein
MFAGRSNRKSAFFLVYWRKMHQPRLISSCYFCEQLVSASQIYGDNWSEEKLSALLCDAFMLLARLLSHVS